MQRNQETYSMWHNIKCHFFNQIIFLLGKKSAPKYFNSLLSYLTNLPAHYQRQQKLQTVCVTMCF